MTPSHPALRVMSASASAAFLALSVGLSAGGAAAADSPDATTPQDCGEACLETEPRPGQGRGKNKETPGPPSPVQPAPPEAPAPDEPVVATAPAADPAAPPATAAPAKTATPTTSAPAATGTSSEPGWNTPYTRSARPTQAAAMSRTGGSGGPDPLNITAGGMLVGISAAAFTWYGRNRVRAH